MQTRPRDVFWLVVAVAAGLGAVGALWSVVRDLLDEPSLGKVLGFALLLLVALWIVGGSWLRTKWGAPAGGTRQMAEDRLRASSDG